MKKFLLYLVKLCLYSFLATTICSCFIFTPPTVITFARIAQTARPLVFLLQYSRQVSEDATISVNTSYSNLSDYMADNNFNGEVIRDMENSLMVMRSKTDTLRFLLNSTEDQAEELFDLLEERADQNTDDNLREIMLEDIDNKRTTFEDKMEIATAVLAQLDESIQKYDNILGYIQVKETLVGIDKKVGNISQIIKEGNNLNREILAAIDEGLDIVGGIQKQAEESSEPAQPVLQ